MKKINLIKLCKNFGIIAGAIVTAYGGFRLVDSVVQIIPAVNEIRTEQKEFKAEQKEMKDIIVDIKEEVKIQGDKIDGVTESIVTYYKSRPEITKEDLIKYVTPIYDELKKNGFLTQQMSPEGAS